MNIAIDMMGGDFAPAEALKGIQLYLAEDASPVKLILIGDEQLIKQQPGFDQVSAGHYTIVHASQVIEMHEHPTKALKEKKHSSIAMGFGLLSHNKAHAFISAGNTGAMMVGSLFTIKAIEGVLRPTIGAYMPREAGELGLLLAVALNADCKPENLSQFAVLASLLPAHTLEFINPRVAFII